MEIPLVASSSGQENWAGGVLSPETAYSFRTI